VQVRVLGTFEILRDGAEITPTAPKLRQLLALLTINANSVVRPEQIVDELWEDHPPLTAATTLQTYIYQLRKSLRLAEPASSLHTVRGGYLLELPAGALDVEEFRRLVQRGRAEADADHLESAAAILRQALRLWRGPVLADIRFGPVLQAEVVSLAEFGRSVREQLFDIELGLGRHHEVIGELRAAVAEQPTHEGYQIKLMLALYRAGRRSEALQVFQDARNVLITELAVDPCPELQRLHQRILAGDPALDLMGPTPRTDRRSVKVSRPGRTAEPPSQLPPVLPVLVGRESAAAALCEVLTAPKRHAPAVAVTVGPPGAGKSAMVVHTAHQVRGEFPDGQLYARLITPEGQPVDPADVLADFLRACRHDNDLAQLAAASLDERVLMFRSWTADKRVLIVLDDVVSDSQLRPLLPTGPGCAALVAGRRRLTDPAIMRTVALVPMDAVEALELMVSVLGRQRVADEAQAAVQLVTLCGGLPLALRAALWWLELRPHWSIQRLVERASQTPTLLLEPGPPELDLLASVEHSSDLLPAAARKAFRLVARGTGKIGPGDLAEAMHKTELEAETLLDKLVEVGLLEVAEPPGGRGGFLYHCHPAIRTAAEEIQRHACEADPCTTDREPVPLRPVAI
jgi:DNA-binding SARP family transcriptional activator